jgi:hypothetical protein
MGYMPIQNAHRTGNFATKKFGGALFSCVQTHGAGRWYHMVELFVNRKGGKDGHLLDPKN